MKNRQITSGKIIILNVDINKMVIFPSREKRNNNNNK